jgi:hypothetical protein
MMRMIIKSLSGEANRSQKLIKREFVARVT